MVAAATAQASSLSVTYTTITTSDPDTGGAVTGVVTGLVKSTLGPDGLPVESNPGTFSDVNGSGELLWWTPHGGDVIAGTTYSYPNPATLPISFDNFFPNGPSGGDGSDVGYTSAILKGTFNTPAGGSVTFSLGSDDDTWVFLNGNLVVDNGGVHADAVAPVVVTGLAPGVNTIEVFYADRHVVQAQLDFTADVTVNPGVPEASTWAMLLAGFGGLGFAAFRRSRKAAVSLVG
jgi:fibro-slime domain-containing protein